MLDEANERERAADERARSWEGRAELGTTLLRAAEDRTDRAQAERQAAERLRNNASRVGVVIVFRLISWRRRLGRRSRRGSSRAHLERFLVVDGCEEGALVGVVVLDDPDGVGVERRSRSKVG